MKRGGVWSARRFAAGFFLRVLPLFFVQARRFAADQFDLEKVGKGLLAELLPAEGAPEEAFVAGGFQ